MKFNPDKVSFGRHETFPLRYAWLTKGFQALEADPKAFESDQATVTLGVGRNMVSAIRYWLQAARMAERRTTGLMSTPLGEAVLGEQGWDPYLEDEATIWLIHWLLATNPERATAWYWFFNHFHKPEFTSQELATALLDFAKERIKVKTAATTLKNDAAIVLRMYVQSTGNTRVPLEEALDSPLALLGLTARMTDHKTYQSKPESRSSLPLGIVGFAVTELFDAKGASEMPIEDLMYSAGGYPALGSVFRLSENGLLTQLEQLVHYLRGKYELRETAGIHQLYRLATVKPLDYLKKHYGDVAKEVAA